MDIRGARATSNRIIGRGVGSLAACAATLTLAGPAQAAHTYKDSVRCGDRTVRSTKIVKTSPHATVFRKIKRVPQHGNVPVAFACLKRGGPINKMQGSHYTRSALGPEFAGRYVAFYEIYDQNEETGSISGVVVLDMKTGEVLFTTEAGGGNAFELVVKRNGSIAWVQRDIYAEGGASDTLFKVDKTTGGKAQPLDSAPLNDDLDDSIKAVRLSDGNRSLTWTRNGVAQSGPID